MPIYVAMLRGINVSGHNLIKMDRLRTAFVEWGFANVATYIQSGNVVFTASKTANRSLEQKISRGIRAEYGFEVPVIVRSAQELLEVVKRSPFAVGKELDPSRLCVIFLGNAAPDNAAEVLQSLAHPSEKLVVNGREIYLSCPNGFADTKLSNAAIERKLGVTATGRNWKTVNALHQMTLKS